MSAGRAIAWAILVWFLADLGHTVWHVRHGDTLGTLFGEIAIDAVLALVAAAALWLPRSIRRPAGGLAAVLVGLFSIARGISGATSSEGAVWIHVLLLLSGLPLAAVGVWILLKRSALADRSEATELGTA